MGIREINCEKISETIARLCVKACTLLPPDVAILLECSAEDEENEAARFALCDLVENFNFAAESGLPICQDTGIAVVFADVGQDVHITGGDFTAAVDEGVRRGYTEGYLRLSVVRDPLRPLNTQDNTPAVLHTRIVPGDKLSLTVAPKGFGSENMSSMKMLLPNSTTEDVVAFITETVKTAGARPCPPVIVGVGLGGTIEQAAIFAKRALLRPVDQRNEDPFYAELEKRALSTINALGIGAQGFGGKHTALAVNLEQLPTHIAGMPCVVNMGCHATRHANAVL